MEQRDIDYAEERARFGRNGYVERNGRRYALAGVRALLIALEGNLDKLCFLKGKDPRKVYNEKMKQKRKETKDDANTD